MIVSNSSPLIYLSKLNKLELLRILFNEIIIPNEVYEEVVEKGKKEKFFDALNVEKSIKEGWIKIKSELIKKEIKIFSQDIDEGELAVISLALKEKPELILIDDASARTIAESLGINTKGTLYVLLKAYKNNIIDKNEAKSLLNTLISSGFRISTELYAEILSQLEK